MQLNVMMVLSFEWRYKAYLTQLNTYEQYCYIKTTAIWYSPPKTWDVDTLKHYNSRQ